MDPILAGIFSQAKKVNPGCIKMKKILLHICCGPDSTAVFERLRLEYEVVGFFFNPNIHPYKEYIKRREETKRVAAELDFKLYSSDYAPDAWEEAVRGLENEPEKGQRCQECFRFNLRAAAAKTRTLNISVFTTTLSISPHKDAKTIFRLGKAAAQEFGIEFLEIDFKKKNGFRRSLELSKSLRLYRQKYCGCRFSQKREKHA